MDNWIESLCGYGRSLQEAIHYEAEREMIPVVVMDRALWTVLDAVGDTFDVVLMMRSSKYGVVVSNGSDRPCEVTEFINEYQEDIWRDAVLLANDLYDASVNK